MPSRVRHWRMTIAVASHSSNRESSCSLPDTCNSSTFSHLRFYSPPRQHGHWPRKKTSGLMGIPIVTQFTHFTTNL